MVRRCATTRPRPGRARRPKIDFKETTGAVAGGFSADYGQGYSNARGYGWIHPGTQVPLSLVGNARNRTDATVPAQRASMIHAQYMSTGSLGTNGVHRQGAWQIAVDNGRYDLELTVGEATPGGDVTRNIVNVEGTTAVDYATVTPAGVAKTGRTGTRP